MADDQDVTPADSSPAEPEIVEPTVPAAVTAVGADRPVENAVAESNRKFSRLEARFNDLVNYVATQRQAAPSAAPQQEVSEDELFRLAQQGDRNAFDLYMERKAVKATQQQMLGLRQQQSVDAQLLALGNKYPVFNDPTHPLTQTANQAYALLIQSGYPQGKATTLEALKTAIADRPDLVSEVYANSSRAHAAVRQSAASRAQSGVTGASHRESPTPVRPGSKLTPDQAALARRMGSKDPGGAIARFKARNASGQSSIGGVASYIDETEIG